MTATLPNEISCFVTQGSIIPAPAFASIWVRQAVGHNIVEKTPTLQNQLKQWCVPCMQAGLLTCCDHDNLLLHDGPKGLAGANCGRCRRSVADVQVLKEEFVFSRARKRSDIGDQHRSPLHALVPSTGPGRECGEGNMRQPTKSAFQVCKHCQGQCQPRNGKLL